MQCSRCSYIQFKSASKCLNCGYDFKNQKSKVLSEVENAFTIFSAAGVATGADANNSSAGIEEDLHQEPSALPMEETELYDSPADLTDLNESHTDNSEDFELDLYEADGSDSENWDIGATLTEDLSDVESATPENSLENVDLDNAELGTGDFEIQGLGFDLSNGLEPLEDEISQDEDNVSTGLGFKEIDDEPTASDMDSITEQNEIPFDPVEDEPVHQAQVDDASHELPNPEESPQEISMEINDSSTQDPEQDMEIELGEISLETEIDLEDKVLDTEPASEIPVDIPGSEIEMNPTLEIEGLQLDLETDSLVIEPITEGSDDPKVSLEDSQLKMDTEEDDTHPLLPDGESKTDG